MHFPETPKSIFKTAKVRLAEAPQLKCLESAAFAQYNPADSRLFCIVLCNGSSIFGLMVSLNHLRRIAWRKIEPG